MIYSMTAHKLLRVMLRTMTTWMDGSLASSDSRGALVACSIYRHDTLKLDDFRIWNLRNQTRVTTDRNIPKESAGVFGK